MNLLKTHQCFDGKVQFWSHESRTTRTPMRFSSFIPNGQVSSALIWLSGLTCTDENFISKAGAQKSLANSKMMVICPDTSPRGLHLPHEHEAYDFGSGAGFYVNATTPGYSDHYRMYDYVANEIYELLQTNFKIKERISICGHSMGGHGALVIGLREKNKFKSISAFSPIVNPIDVPWGQKAFKGYLGDDKKTWHHYDACRLVKDGFTHDCPILIDQGLNDEFLNHQLFPESFRGAGAQKVILRMQPGYDHSYYFISTFIADHVEFHAGHLSSETL